MGAQIQLWQGQFPPPEAIERYELVQPGAFDRIIAMAEKAQALQAADIERSHLLTSRDMRRAHYLGAGLSALALVLAAVCVGIGAYTGTSGPYVVAGGVLSLPVMGVARALIESVWKRSHPKGQ